MTPARASGPVLRVRDATPEDLARVAELAARLVHFHEALDPRRFLHLEDPARGYARYFASEIARPEAVIVVAELDATVVGYAYGRLEERSYNELLDACGKLHDLWVEPDARGAGAGEALVRAVLRKLASKGAPRTLLLTATQNEAAQRLFARLGFRTTMLEMTREADAS